MPLPTPRTIGAPAAPATDVARHASRAMLSRFIGLPRSLMNLPECSGRSERAPCFAQKRRRSPLAPRRMHDRLARTLAKRPARGLQEMGIFFKVARALFATSQRSRARDA